MCKAECSYFQHPAACTLAPSIRPSIYPKPLLLDIKHLVTISKLNRTKVPFLIHLYFTGMLEGSTKHHKFVVLILSFMAWVT